MAAKQQGIHGCSSTEGGGHATTTTTTHVQQVREDDEVEVRRFLSLRVLYPTRKKSTADRRRRRRRRRHTHRGTRHPRSTTPLNSTTRCLFCALRGANTDRPRLPDRASSTAQRLFEVTKVAAAVAITVGDNTTDSRRH